MFDFTYCFRSKITPSYERVFPKENILFRKFLLSSVFFCAQISATEIKHTATPIMIDGAAEQTWDNAQWQPMAYLMAGSQPKETDFSGRYKLLWDNQYLYLQAQITDDILFDKTADPTVKYWDDDCLEA